METTRFCLLKDKINCKISGEFTESEIKKFAERGFEEQTLYSASKEDKNKLQKEAENGKIIRLC